MKVARIATVPFSLYSYRFHFEGLEKKNIKITLISSNNHHYHLLNDIKVSQIKPINIEREIHILKDIISVIKLYFDFKFNDYDIIHSSTPKAGLLVAIAGKLAGKKIVLHTFTGQRWDTLTGLKRKILIWCDKLICFLNKAVYADSPSQVEYLIQNKIVTSEKIKCLGQGSYAGILIEKFKPISLQDKIERRNFLKIPNDAFVISFVGRVVKDKGVVELSFAFKNLLDKYKNIYLMIIGPEEKNSDPIPCDVENFLYNCNNVSMIGYVTNPEYFIGASDLICLPSHREGFGSVILEAAAMGIPSVATNIKGVKDAIIPNETGRLFDCANIEQLTSNLEFFILHQEKVKEYGDKAKTRATKYYSSDKLIELVSDEYRSLLK